MEKGRTKAAIERVFSPSSATGWMPSSPSTSLAPEVVETIVEKFILQLETQLAERHVAITLAPDARAWLAKKGYDPKFGARPLARLIQTEVRDHVDRRDSLRPSGTWRAPHGSASRTTPLRFEVDLTSTDQEQQRRRMMGICTPAAVGAGERSRSVRE